MRKTLLLGLLLLLMKLSFGQLGLEIGSLTLNQNQIGTQVNVPILVTSGYNLVGSMQFEIVFDPAVLSPVSQSATNAGLVNPYTAMPLSQWICGAGTGYSISSNWLDPSFNGVNIPTGVTLFELKFTYLGGICDLSFNSTNSLAYDNNYLSVPLLLSNGNIQTAATAPVISFLHVDSIGSTAANLYADVHPGSIETSIEFEYGTDSTLTTTVVPGNPYLINGNQVITASCQLSGLSSGTTYYYRAIASNAVDTSYTHFAEFSTVPPTPPTIVNFVISSLSDSSIQISTAISANNASTQVILEYGNTSALGTTDTLDTIYGSDTISISASIGQLLPNQSYYLQIYAVNSAGTQYSNVIDTMTLKRAPYCVSSYADGINLTTANLHGKIVPQNDSTVVAFVYGVGSTFSDTLALSNNFTGMDTISVETNASNLLPNTYYAYKIIASNSAGMMESNIVEFNTIISDIPEIISHSLLYAGSTDALFNMEVNPSNAETTIYIEYGTSPQLGNNTLSNPLIINGVNPSTHIYSLHSLLSLTQYYYRIVAENMHGIHQTGIHEFSTNAENYLQVGVSVPENTIQIGDTIAIPLIIESGCTDVMAIQFLINFNQAVLSPIQISSTNYGIINPSSSTTGNGGEWFCGNGTQGELSPNWFDPSFSGVSLTSGDTLFEFYFTYLGGSTSVQASIESCYIYNTNNDLLNLQFNSGYIGILIPAVYTLAATGIDYNEANLEGLVNAFGESTMVYFEYGLSDTYGMVAYINGNTTTCSYDSLVKAAVFGLEANQTYHYRIVAENLTEISFGKDRTFYTNPIGIPSSEMDAIKIFSFDDFVFLDLHAVSSEKWQVKIFDTKGSLLINKEISDIMTAIQINSGSGIYLIHLQSGNKRITQKVYIK